MSSQLSKYLQISSIGLIVTMSLITAGCDLFGKKATPPAPVQTAPAQVIEQKAAPTLHQTYVQPAKAGLIAKLGTQGYYKLTLYKVQPYLTFYTARPNRDTGLLPTQDFLKTWATGPHNFQEDNPNALITAAIIDGVVNKDSTVYFVSISTPYYNSDRNQVEYVIKPLPNHDFMFEQITLEDVVLMID